MSREPPQLHLKLLGFTITATGLEAIRAVRWPIAAVIIAVAGLIAVMAFSRV